jgi:hypothetical protein
MVWFYAVAILGGLYVLMGALIVMTTGADIDVDANGRWLATLGRGAMTIAMVALLARLGGVWRRLERWMDAGSGAAAQGLRGALVFLAAPAMIGAAIFVLILASIATGENSWEAAFGP